MTANNNVVLTRFIPVGCSKVSDSEACVGAIRDDGSWVRPETPSLAAVKEASSPFGYFQYCCAPLDDSIEHHPRPEDRHMVERPSATGSVPEGDRLAFLRRHADAGVERVFGAGRTLGLVQVRVHRVYSKPFPGGRMFLRTAFSDATGESFDWMIGEVWFADRIADLLSDGRILPQTEANLGDFFAQAETFYTIALTKPNNRFPGKYGRCHPVVIGIHSFPDYGLLLAADPRR